MEILPASDDAEAPVSSSRKKRLLYVSRTQFGYMLPTYHVCRMLSRHFELAVVSIYQGRPEVEVPGVTSLLAGRDRGRLGRFLMLVLQAGQEARAADIVVVEHFPGASTIRPFALRVPMVLDIRTGGVMESAVGRVAFDQICRLDALFFSNLCVISSGLANRLGVDKRAHVVPLGADEKVLARTSDPDALHLLYVGTLTGRRIEDTLLGLRYFLDEHERPATVRYDIVGSGRYQEEAALREHIEKLGLADIVVLHGFVHHNELDGFLGRANVGVSYVPITPYYDVQPATKTYEYLLAGLPVLATRTKENSAVVSDSCGVLIDDNPREFARGLHEIRRLAGSLDPQVVRHSARAYTWKAIVDENFAPYLFTLSGGRARKAPR